MKYVIVLPYAYGPYVTECLETLDINIIENCVAIDNTDTSPHENFGVAGTWNLGIDRLREVDGDWLVVMSAAMRFRDGGQSMIDWLEQRQGQDYLIHFAKADFPEQQWERGRSVGIEAGNFVWHLTAISREAIENVGKFDTGFFPVYFEDVDYDLRVKKIYGDKQGWSILPIDAYSKSLRHGVELGGVKSYGEPLAAYFRRKWGKDAGSKYEEYWDHPFNDQTKSLSYFPLPDDPLSIYNNELKDYDV